MYSPKQKLVIKYSWDNSFTEGGYLEEVMLRFLRKKYKNNFENFTYLAEMGVIDAVQHLSIKYQLELITQNAIIIHLRKIFFVYPKNNTTYSY